MSEVQKINTTKNRQHTHILSHATIVPAGSKLVYLSGQVPAGPDGKVVDGGIKEHTAQCINNLGNVLEAAGSSWEKVAKVNIYLKDLNDFGAVNEVYEKLLPDPKPARTCLEVARLPGDVDIEIEAVAVI